MVLTMVMPLCSKENRWLCSRDISRLFKSANENPMSKAHLRGHHCHWRWRHAHNANFCNLALHMFTYNGRIGDQPDHFSQ
eukprot:440727-Amphidinium_carterae.1